MWILRSWRAVLPIFSSSAGRALGPWVTVPLVHCRSTTRTVKEPGFGFVRALCPSVEATVSISVADRKSRLVLGSNAIFFALG